MTATKIESEKSDILDLMEIFGRYQTIQYILISLPIFFVAMTSVNYIFTVGDLKYRCQIDECEDVNSTAQFPSWWPDTKIDRCSRPVLKNGEKVCTNNSFTGELISCKHWIYENNNTIIAELNLGCQSWKSGLVGTFHNMGMTLSLLISGWMCDRFGRKPTLLICVVGGSIGMLKTFATSYYMFAVIEFLEGLIIGGSYAASTILLMEIVGKKYRALSCAVFTYTTEIGEAAILGIVALIPRWKTFIYVINGPCLLFVTLVFFVNESPRWVLVKERVEDAKKIITKIAEVNKIKIDSEELANIKTDALKEKLNIRNNEVRESFVSAMKSKEIIKRTIAAGMGRFTTNYIYFGMLINSVWLPGDKYLNYFLSTLVSLPGELLSLYLMNKVGRKNSLLVGYMLCGTLCIISGFIPDRYLYVKLTLFVIGKVIISGCLTAAITHGMEMFPTSVRGSLVGVTSFGAEIGAMLAPLTPILNTVSHILPFTLFGCLSILTGLALCLTPETKGLPLFDTIKQMENYKRSKYTTKDIPVCTEYSTEAFCSHC